MDSISHKWAHRVKNRRSGLIEGKYGNVFYDGASLFSYGRHYEVGRLVTNKRGETAALLNCDRYSVSTARHCSDARSATNYMRQFFVPLKWERGDTKSFFETYRARMMKALENAVATSDKRVVGKWEQYRIAENMVVGGNEYAAFFGIRTRLQIPKKYRAALEIAREKYAIHNAATHEKRQALRDKIDAELRRTMPERIARWRAGNVWVGGAYWDIGEYALLRVSADGDRIETSLGASAPIDHVRRAYQFLAPFVARGESWATNGKTIHVGDFTVDSLDINGKTCESAGCNEYSHTAVIRAGCHTILWSEVEMIATQCGWINDASGK